MDMFIALIVLMVLLVYKYVRLCQIVYYKYAKFLICHLHFNEARKNIMYSYHLFVKITPHTHAYIHKELEEYIPK